MASCVKSSEVQRKVHFSLPYEHATREDNETHTTYRDRSIEIEQ